MIYAAPCADHTALTTTYHWQFVVSWTREGTEDMDWIALSFILPVCLFPWSSDTACYVSVALIQIIPCPSPASHSLIKINWNSFNISKFGILSPVSACQQLQAAWPLFTQTQTAAAWTLSAVLQWAAAAGARVIAVISEANFLHSQLFSLQETKDIQLEARS